MCEYIFDYFMTDESVFLRGKENIWLIFYNIRRLEF